MLNRLKHTSSVFRGLEPNTFYRGDWERAAQDDEILDKEGWVDDDAGVDPLLYCIGSFHTTDNAKSIRGYMCRVLIGGHPMRVKIEPSSASRMLEKSILTVVTDEATIAEALLLGLYEEVS